MKKVILTTIALVSLTSSVQAQYVIGSTFQPMSLERMMVPYLMYKQAQDEAIAKINSYIDKYSEAFYNGNYRLAKYYLESCVQLNNRFEGTLIKSKTLKEAIDQCDELIKQQDEQQAQLRNRNH